MKFPNFDEEKKLWRQDYKMVVGLDEAGRGPLAGPVVAAAICIKNPVQEGTNLELQKTKKSLIKIKKSKNLSGFIDVDLFGNWDLGFGALGIKDSKKLPAKQREKLYSILTNHPLIQWGVGIVSEKVIDKINILGATKLAMKGALRSLATQGKLENNVDFLLIDGNFALNNIKTPQKSIIKADEKVFSCVVAGIVAKVTRDRIMDNLHKKYPKYGFNKHKGYGTALHIKNLQAFGPCKIHRKSFYPVNSIYKS